MTRILAPLLLLLLLAAAPAAAENPKLRLRHPGDPPWEQNELPYTTQAAALYFDGVNYHPEPAPGRSGIAGTWYRYPISGITLREVFVPALIWSVPDFFAPHSPIPHYRRAGEKLTRDLARDTTVDAQLGIDPQRLGEIQLLFPRAFSGTVSTQEVSFGLAKARF